MASSDAIRLKNIPSHPQRSLPALQGLAESVVFHLDANRPSIGGFIHTTHESAPIHFAVARNARLVPFGRVGKDPDLVEAVAADFDIFSVEMEQLLLEFKQRAGRVHLLKNKM